jgi:hypothetical protein
MKWILSHLIPEFHAIHHESTPFWTTEASIQLRFQKKIIDSLILNNYDDF